VGSGPILRHSPLGRKRAVSDTQYARQRQLAGNTADDGPGQPHHIHSTTEPSSRLVSQPEHSLSPEHRRVLEDESAIAPEVIAERGYRTIVSPADLLDLGFATSQRRVPGLLLPLHPTNGGEPPLCVFRPDRPRELRGKDGSVRILKYEVPKGASTRLDCPPSCQALLADPSVPLWITEGQKKADALASLGLCAIALLGVWSWRGRNAFGGTTFLADWDHVALNGRDVRVVFDSDVMTKRQVHQALDRMRDHLQRKGAHVTAAYLPQRDGHKLGVDDWLAEGHTLDELEGLVEPIREAPKAATPSVELLDEVPAEMRRPLSMIGDHAYAAAWLPCRVTETERETAKGDVIILNPPEIRDEIRLFVVRDDGVIFGEGGDQTLDELGFVVTLPEVPPARDTLTTRAAKGYRAGERPDPVHVFSRVVDVVDRFIDFERSLSDQRTMAELVACFTLATWFLDAFDVIGFLWPNGDRGSGKTHLLLTVTELGFLGQCLTAGGSFAALRDLADYGAVLGFDDAEHVNDPKRFDPDKRSLLLAGNRRGTTVPLKEPVGPREWRTRYVNAFCPRLFSAIRMPDAVLASRTIVIPLVRTADRRKGNADPLDPATWPHERRQLIDDLWCLGLAHLRDLRQHDAAVAQSAILVGRALQPWRAILAVARWLDEHGAPRRALEEGGPPQSLFQRLDALSVKYQVERPNLELSDITVLVLKALHSLAQATLSLEGDASDTRDGSDAIAATERLYFVTKEVRERLDGLAEREEIDVGWMGEERSRTMRVGRILSSLRLESDPTSAARRWAIGRGQLSQLLVSYGIIADPLSVQAPPPSEASEASSQDGLSMATDALDRESEGPAGHGGDHETEQDALSGDERAVLDALRDLGSGGYSTVSLRLRRQPGPTRVLLEDLRRHGLVRCARGVYSLVEGLGPGEVTMR